MKKFILSLIILLSITAIASAQVAVVRTPCRRAVITPVYVAPRIIEEPVVLVEPVVRPAIVVAPVVVAPLVAERYPVRRAAFVRRRAVYYR